MEGTGKPAASVQTAITAVIVHLGGGEKHEIPSEKIPKDGLTYMGPRGEPASVAEWLEDGETFRVWFGFPLEVVHKVQRIARAS